MATSGPDTAASYEWLPEVPFPAEILALPHVLKTIHSQAMDPDDAFTEAAGDGDWETMHNLMGRFEIYDPSDALIAAAANCHRELVALILCSFFVEFEEDEENPVFQIVRWAAIAAAQKGHTPVVEVVCGIFPSTLMMASVMVVGAGHGHVDVVKYVVDAAEQFGKLSVFSYHAGAESLAEAIRHEHDNVVEYLLNVGGEGWDLAQVFAAAIESGLMPVVERIIQHFEQKDDGKDLFVELVRGGNVDAMKHLYDNGHEDGELVDKAFVTAASAQLIYVLEFLLATDHVSAEAFDSAFERAAEIGIELVFFLSNKKRASSAAIYRAFEAATTLDVITFLYENERIPDSSIAAAIQRCGSNENDEDSEILEFLGRV